MLISLTSRSAPVAVYIGACLAAVAVFGQAAVSTSAVPVKVGPRRDVMPQALSTNMNRVASDRLELPIRKSEKRATPVPDLKPEDQLISVNGTTITWGAMRRYAELLTSDFRLPPGVTAADFAAERDNILMRNVFKLAASFISKTVLAQEASQHGMHITPEAFTARQKALASEIQKSGKKEAYGKEITQPGSFLWYEVTNSLLVAKLTSDVIRPAVKVSTAEVDAYIKARVKENGEIAAYNKGLRPRIESLLKRVRAGEASFADAAFGESDCPSSAEYGEMGSVKLEDLRTELTECLLKQKDGGISDVVETPHSYHILKLNKKNSGFLKEGEKGPAPVASINFAHIMLEKKELNPPLTTEEARDVLVSQRIRTTVDDLKERLIKSAKIDTPLPLYAPSPSPPPPSLKKIR